MKNFLAFEKSSRIRKNLMFLKGIKDGKKKNKTNRKQARKNIVQNTKKIGPEKRTF